MRPMPELKIETARVADLVPYAGNAKEHPAEQIEQIAASMSEFGNNDPIAVWTNAEGRMEIVEGHGRVMALQRLGIKEAPIIHLDHLSDEQRRAYTHVHNQTTMNSGFDLEALAADLDELSACFDFGDFGFDIAAVNLDGDADLEEVIEDEVPTEADTRVQPGEVWQLGEHLMMCGSATDPADMRNLARGGVAQLMVTDPPYNVSLGQEAGHALRPSEAKQLHRRTDGLVIENDSWSDDEAFVEFLASAYDAALPVMQDGAAFYIWHASTQSHNFREACRRSGMEVRQVLVWVKDTFALGRQDYQWRHEPCLYGWKDGAAHYFFDSRKESTVVEDDLPNFAKMKKDELRAKLEELYSDKASTTVLHEKKPTRNAEHPTMKPVRLIARLVRNSSKPGWTVLDPFGGSGTTLMACEQLGRKCLTMEVDPKYCDVIIARWESFTGKEAVRL